MNPGASKARKCLFGRPDHQQLESDLQRELNKDAREMNEKYDFDFQEGKPLKGTKYEWVEVNEPPKENEGQPKSSGVTETGDKEITRKNPVEEQLQDHKTPSKKLQ
ncbi:cyclin-dependent kinase inhibitor 1B-like [Orbicella faveolata]|uniref:cyclin-dependent kinase inhibitor 1B-like n=1 Tax=Orbicella faveolata TaxID=48498 RepID=UPI0009E3FDE3|nr:cyclin-dependent kinase inhibitor 1B-like [Orbicella faveolata]